MVPIKSKIENFPLNTRTSNQSSFHIHTNSDDGEHSKKVYNLLGLQSSKSFASSEKREKKTVEELNMLPLCFEKKKRTKRRNRGRVLFRMNAHFLFILSNAHRTSSRALSLSLLCYFSRNSSGRKEVVVVE